MTVLDRLATKHGIGYRFCAASAFAAVFAAVPDAQAEKKEDTSLGAEFIDMPEGWDAPQPKPKADEPKGDEREWPGYLPGYRRYPSLGLSPQAPMMHSALPGGVAPPFGAKLPEDKQYQFSFTGYLQGGFRGAFGKRDTDTAYENQRLTTIHGDPMVPGASWGWFDHTMTVPGPWAHLMFQYGNDTVQATAMLGAWSVGETMLASGYYQMIAQNWFHQAYLTYTPHIEDLDPIATKVMVGAYQDRYGAMGQYTEGAYSVALIGKVRGVGTTATVSVPFEHDLDLTVEGGFKGDINRAPAGIGLNPAYEHPQPDEGSTYAAHGHAGLTYAGKATPSIHYIYSWSQDERSDPEDIPGTAVNESYAHKDGSISVLGADLRIDGGRFGYLYVGGSRITGKNASSVTDLVNIINTGGGKDFKERFWSFESEGNGTLTLFGTQYTLSLGTLLRYPDEFWGEGPDLTASLFTIAGRSNSSVDEYDKTMVKYGAELTYSMLPWLAASGRFDHVYPELDEPERQFAVFSPKLVFRTDWKTREALTLQYAYYSLASDVVVQGDDRLLNAPSGRPDRHLVTLFGTIWW